MAREIFLKIGVYLPLIVLYTVQKFQKNSMSAFAEIRQFVPKIALKPHCTQFKPYYRKMAREIFLKIGVYLPLIVLYTVQKFQKNSMSGFG